MQGLFLSLVFIAYCEEADERWRKLSNSQYICVTSHRYIVFYTPHPKVHFISRVKAQPKILAGNLTEPVYLYVSSFVLEAEKSELSSSQSLLRLVPSFKTHRQRDFVFQGNLLGLHSFDCALWFGAQVWRIRMCELGPLHSTWHLLMEFVLICKLGNGLQNRMSNNWFWEVARSFISNLLFLFWELGKCLNNIGGSFSKHHSSINHIIFYR